MARAPSKSSTLPAPVAGWDTREALADMPQDRAVILENWFPSTDKVTIRRGYASHATGLGAAVETLLEYVPQTGTAQLYGCAGANIYNVSSAGAVGAAVDTGFTSARFQQVQIGTAGGQFLFCCNGADTPRTYNGTTWANSTISGPTIANLIWCNTHSRRLWVGEKESLTAWYLPVVTIGGAATSFSLAGLASKGGYIMGMGTWTRDGGSGSDDVAVFLTSEGQAIVYSGTDPSSASTWSMIGVFDIGKPIGRRCMVKAGTDLLLLTQDGAVPLASILPVDRAQAEKASITAQINKAFNDAVRSYSSNFGWQPILYPKSQMIIFNIPKSATVSDQYVFNALTKAPCKFTGIPAQCWGLLGDNIYFGSSDGKVYLFDTGTDDDGTNIDCDALQAFNYFKSPGVNKAFKLVEPIFESDGNPNAALDLCVDFKIQAPSGVSAASYSTAGLWDAGLWDTALWGGDADIYRGWRGVRGIGRSAALRMRISTNNAHPSWIATSFTYIEGGQL